MGLSFDPSEPIGSVDHYRSNHRIERFDPPLSLVRVHLRRRRHRCESLPVSSSAGTVLCTKPVAFWGPDATPPPMPPASHRSRRDSPSSASAVAVAIEFDTMANQEFADPSDNHVWLDLGSPLSSLVAMVDLAASVIHLKSGNLTTAWIDYRSADLRLEVSLSSNAAAAKAKPVLSVAVDLLPYLKEATYVDFLASTEGSTQQHTMRGSNHAIQWSS